MGQNNDDIINKRRFHKGLSEIPKKITGADFDVTGQQAKNNRGNLLHF